MSCKDCGHENETEARFCAGCGTPLALAGPAGEDSFIGQVVGDRYRIVARIGEGGMGVVYLAEQKLGSTVRKVAVKTLHAELSQDPAITARFHREVGTVASLEHPNTVRVYDFGSTADGTLYIAMEFLDGVPLQKLIDLNGTLDATRVAHIVKQMAGSLDEAHNKGIVHRDLKPENVLLIERAGEPDVVKLVDFGIAARTESSDAEKEQKLTQQGMVLGTPPYMSPEQFSGKPVDRRSDIYSLGIMAYEMLSGQLPFQAETAWQWATHHMTTVPKDLKELPGAAQIPESARAAVMKSLSKDPDRRQANAGSFFSDFQSASLSSVDKNKAPAGKVDAYQATQAMEEMPDMQSGSLQSGVAATEAMPEMGGPISPAPAVVAPRRAQRNKPGKGLVFGLAGLGGALLLAMGIVAIGQDNDGPPPPAASSLGAEPGTSLNAPETDLASAVEATAEALGAGSTPENGATGSSSADAVGKPSASKPRASKPSASRPKSGSKPRATPPKKPKPQAVKPKASTSTKPAPAAKAPPPIATPTKVRSTKNACRACLSAVAKKDLLSAGQYFSQCTNKRKKSQCRARAAQIAPKLATQQAYNGKCSQATAIMMAAQQMGVPSSRFAKAKKECK